VNWGFWIFAAVLAAAAVALLLRPLLRRQEAVASSAAYDLQVYKDQLAEVARELERGNLSPGEAQAAQAEIERRLLRAAEAGAEAGAEARRARAAKPAKALALALVVALPLGSLALYLYVLGSPGLPSIPFAERAQERQQLGERERLVAELAERMRQDPGDPRGWEILARNYAVLGRYEQAAAAFRQAISRGADRAEVRAQHAETLVAAADGVVTPEAQAEIEAALERNPEEPLARYYRGVAHEQSGEPRQAVETWAALLRDLPPDIAGRPQILQRLRAVAAEAGLDPQAFDVASRRAPAGASPPAASGGASGPAPGPTREQMQAAQDLTADERQAMIQGMVERLAGRLEENPEDLEGWLRLARAYAVLGRRDDALSALERAEPLAEALPADDPLRQAVQQGLQSLREGGS
jgi:cytochrome c-type biogenesis protein CcmH